MVAPVYANFVPPAIDAGNLNEINTVIYDLLGDGTNPPTNDSDIRTNIGLGTIATQDANNVAITGGSISGITDLAIADGGTGASTAATARTNLGVAQIGPAFSANITGTQALASGVTTLVLFQTEDFDTDNYYDPANGRFTPLVAGYYQLSSSVVLDGGGNIITGARTGLYKNAAEYQRGVQLNLAAAATTSTVLSTVTALVFFNGTTDFVDIRATASTSAGAPQVLQIAATRFSGYFVRP